MKKIILVIVTLFLFLTKIQAISYKGCDVKDISNLKSFVNNINIYYDYTMVNNSPIFSVTIVNILPDMYFTDIITDKTYYYSNTNNGEITISGYNIYSKDGRYMFYSAKSGCYGVLLGSKFYTFPSYNKYYETDVCKGYSDLSICSKWVKNNYTEDEMQELIYEYNKENIIIEEEEEIKKDWIYYIIDFYVKYYLLILLSIIILCSSIIFIKKSRENKFKNKLK